MTTHSEKKFLSDLDLAERWGISRDSVHRWKRSGTIPMPKKLGANCTRWSLEEIEQYEADLEVREGAPKESAA